MVAGDQGAQRAIGVLLQDLVDRRQAVERRVGVLAQDDDAVGSAVLGGEERDQVRIGLLKQLGVVSELPALDELLDITCDANYASSCLLLWMTYAPYAPDRRNVTASFK